MHSNAPRNCVGLLVSANVFRDFLSIFLPHVFLLLGRQLSICYYLFFWYQWAIIVHFMQSLWIFKIMVTFLPI